MKNKITDIIRIKPVVAFFIVTFTISWILWLPMLFFGESNLLILGSFGPAVSALIITYCLQGVTGIKNLLKKFTIIKVNIFWYIFGLFSTAVVVMISIIFFKVFENKEFIFNDIRQWYLIIPAFFYILFFSVLGEEIGWRGFALPRLQERYNALTSSLIIGVLWGIWHLPLFFVTGNFHTTIPISLFILQSVALSILYTWIYNSTKGSLIPVHIFHAASNVTLGVLPILPIDTGNDIRPLWVTVIILVVISITIIIKNGAGNLSKQLKPTI